MIFFTKEMYEKMQLAAHMQGMEHVMKHVRNVDKEMLDFFASQGRDYGAETFARFDTLKPLFLRYVPDSVVDDLYRAYIYETAERTEELSSFIGSWVKEYEEQWSKASRGCYEQFQQIRDSLPVSFVEMLKTYSFHDAKVLSIEKPQPDTVVIELDCKGCLMPFLGIGRMTFQNVRYAELPDEPRDDWWLYDEIHLSEDGTADFRALLHAQGRVPGQDEYLAMHTYRIVAGEASFEELIPGRCESAL